MASRIPFILLALSSLVCPPSSFADEAAEKLVLATYKLANDSSTATGTVYQRETGEGKSQCFLVTAAHVFERMKSDTCVLVSRTRREDGVFLRQEIQIPVRQAGKPLWKKHGAQDIAVLLLPESVSVEALPFDCLATEESLKPIRVGDDVRLAVFPERSEANPAGFPVLRGGSLASHPLLPVKPHPMFLVDTTAWPGDSGGPVSHKSVHSPSGGPLVIGIVRGMRSITDTVKESRYVERKTNYPLGISEVLHAALARDLILEQWPE
jgi:Trypsin-like peptidase domain